MKTNLINANSNPFYQTRQMFNMYIDPEELKTYDDWMNLPEGDKAAALFVIFFEQITLAWYKCKSHYTEDADGVSTVLQYLEKNVAKIEDDAKRYTPNYIYRVAYNCLSCLGYIKRDIRRYENERSNIEYTSEGVVDLFDTAVDDDDVFYKVFEDEDRTKFWEIIESADKNTKQVIAELLDERKPKSKRITDEQRTEIMLNLRNKLAEYRLEFCF